MATGGAPRASAILLDLQGVAAAALHVGQLAVAYGGYLSAFEADAYLHLDEPSGGHPDQRPPVRGGAVDADEVDLAEVDGVLDSGLPGDRHRGRHVGDRLERLRFVDLDGLGGR